MERTFGTDISNRGAPLNQLTRNGKPPVVISVEAAIGTGKSSLLKLIQAQEPSWIVVQEPVDMWQKVGGKHNLLEKFYSDLERYAFSFQTFCVLSRIETVVKALKECHDDTPVIVLERSWFTDRHTFAEMLRKQQRISEMEWCLYHEWYQFAVRNAPSIHGHVYLDCSTDTCMGRLRKRNRSEEAGITSDYQSNLIDHHEQWLETLEGHKVCRIDVNDDFIHKPENSEAIMEKIRNFAQTLRQTL